MNNATDAVVAAAPEWAARRAARLTPEVERLHARTPPASLVVGGEADRVELHTLGTSRRPRAALAVGTGAPLGTADRYAVHSAIALLTLTTERSRSLHEAEQRVGAAVLRMLLAGEPEHARTAAGSLYGDLLDAPYRLIIAEAASATAARAHADGRTAPHGAPRPVDAPRPVAGERAVAAPVRAGEPPAGPLAALAEHVEAAAARAGEAILVDPDGERLFLL
ncbi:regulatory protein, partial [Streptomyces albidoflavus]